MKLKITHIGWLQIANILTDIGQVSFASIAIPFFLESLQPIISTIGLLAALICWTASVIVKMKYGN